jgi:hypothetical protein
MKYFDKTFDSPYTQYCVIPREDINIVFRCTAVLNDEKFLALCPEPKPPIKSDGTLLFDDPTYKKKSLEWVDKKLSWLFLMSVKDTEGLTWDTIDYNNAETWSRYRQELRDAFFTDGEINRIVETVFKVNSLNPELFEEALQSFLAGRGKGQ